MMINLNKCYPGHDSKQYYLFDNISKRLQILRHFINLSTRFRARIAGILLFQSCLRNVADIFRNFYEMFHFSVKVFLKYF